MSTAEDWQERQAKLGDISDAADYVGNYLAKWGRIRVFQTKEKFGEARVYCDLGWYSLVAMVYPMHYCPPAPLWLKFVDRRFFSWILVRLGCVVYPFHRWIYRRGYASAVKKWPEMKDAIIDGADYTELLEGL